MCSPMFELPEHFPIPVNVDGQGPTNTDEAVRIVCWCANGENCQIVTPSSP